MANCHPFYNYTQQRIFANDWFKLLWFQTIATAHSVDRSRSDLVLILKEKRASLIVFMAEKQQQKIQNYGPLAASITSYDFSDA